MSLTLLEAAKAKLEGKRVEYNLLGEWVEWSGEIWNEDWFMRIAPEPKKKVKLLAWFDGYGLLHQTVDKKLSPSWKRMPNLDLEGEVEE